MNTVWFTQCLNVLTAYKRETTLIFYDYSEKNQQCNVSVFNL